MKLGLDILVQKIWTQLGMVRVYTKKKGAPPDFDDPIILTEQRGGLRVYDCIMQIHKSLLNDFSCA